MTQMVMYLLPMLLGRTFDIRTGHVGVDIYSEDVVRNPEVQQIPNFNSDYKVIRELKDIEDLLKIEGELSLKVKAGFVKVGGSGSYLKDHAFRDDVVEVLTVVNFQTEEHSIPSSIRPVSNLDKFRPEDLGTHYVKGVIYGGELVASFKFRAVDKKDISSIKASVDAAIGSDESINVEVAGKLEMLQKNLEGKASLEISYHASVPLDGVALTLSGYRDLISKFESQVKLINGGLGVPIKVELEEMSMLDEKFKFEKPKFEQHALNTLERSFDDLTITRDAITTWLKDVGFSITKEEEKKVDKLYSEIIIILEVLTETIAKLDEEKGPEHIAKALQAYKNTATKGVLGKFQKAWESLRQKMIVSETVKTEKTTYVHWGKKTCTGLKSTIIVEGYIAAAVEESSPAEILCLPLVPRLGNEIADGKEKKVDAVRFGTVRLNPFKNLNFEHPINCAVCLASERSTVVTLAGRSICPEGWKKEYEGYYLAGRETSPKSEAICVDSDPDVDEIKESLGKFLLVVTYEGQAVPCVLCSK